jgi:small subunit ribosomal protein S13
MAEEKQKKQEAKQEQPKQEKKSLISKEAVYGKIVRILQTDVPADRTLYAGLTRIKGISWFISNAVCMNAKMDRTRKIDSLSKEEILKIEETIKEAKFPKFMINRRSDFTTGEDLHLSGNALDLAKELDVKRLKKIRSFRGLRHATGQPTRGQRTRSHFRTNRKKGVGITKVKAAVKPAAAGGKA